MVKGRVTVLLSRSTLRWVMRVKVAGDWKISVPYARVGPTWTKMKEALVKVNGAWKQFYLELSLALATNATQTVNSYEYRRNITLTLAGTYGGTVTVARVSGSSSISYTKNSDSSWQFYLASAVGAQTAVYRFTYANALESAYIDVEITVSKTSPPPPPPPPPYVPPPYVPPPPPPGGGGGSGVIVDYVTYAKTFVNFTWGIRNGPPNGNWWAEVSWNPSTLGVGSGRIPPAGVTLPLNAAGAATYYDGHIPVTGYHRIIWHFNDGQTVTKYIYVPYYWEDFRKEYGYTQAKAAPYAYYYTTFDKIAEVDGQARYGLARAPDKGGLAWWISQVDIRGYPWTYQDVQGFSVAATLANPSDNAATRTAAKSYRGGYWGGDFFDALPTRF